MNTFINSLDAYCKIADIDEVFIIFSDEHVLWRLKSFNVGRALNYFLDIYLDTNTVKT